MACPPCISSHKKFLFCSYFALILVSLSLKNGHCLEESQSATESHFHSVDISEILPSSACKPYSSPKGPNEDSKLKILDRHGACYEGESKKPTLGQILTQDQLRVASIQSRQASAASSSNTTNLSDQKTRIPGKYGAFLGVGNYVVTVGLGTPKTYNTLIFDTGSDLTWTQCRPCARYCHPQQDPIYNPWRSSTYSNIACASRQCSLLFYGTGQTPACSGRTCVYGIQYGDRSFSVGFLAKETLTLGRDVFPNFLFGCGQNNQGLFGRTDGLLGLGRSYISLVSQTARKYGKVFSYCLPTMTGSNGYLSFGKEVYSRRVQFTPFSRYKLSNNFYFVDIVSISVGGRVLPIQASVFQRAGTVVDSGTVITRLPPAAYSALRNAFRQQMRRYKIARAFSLLDTCYDLRAVRSIVIPKIRFSFRGNANIDLGPRSILVAVSQSQVCLAFAGNAAATDVGIFGNIQQQTLQVVYDVAGGRLGFGAGGCS